MSILPPGQYDDEAERVRAATGAHAVILFVLDGPGGSGFAVSGEQKTIAVLPDLLRQLAAEMRPDLARMFRTSDDADGLRLYAWIGPDETGSGVVGIKQARVPAGMIPIVATQRGKVDRAEIRDALQRQARTYGVTIRLAEYVLLSDELVVLHGAS